MEAVVRGGTKVASPGGMNESMVVQRVSEESLVGLLVGGAVGDALGLPMEGLSARRARLLFGETWRHRFWFGRGVVSDDTEHTVMVAQALLGGGDDAAFVRALSWKLRWWLLALPAGVGLGTGRAIVRMWLGRSPRRSGVPSAGNGPSMRAAIIGAVFASDAERRRAFVAASTRLTHTDPRAEVAALAVAELAGFIVRESRVPARAEALAMLHGCGADAEWTTVIDKLGMALAYAQSTREYAASIGCDGFVTGYSYHSVPVALYATLRHPESFDDALLSALVCGGDTDSVGAVVGQLMGLHLGADAIRRDWRVRLTDWPFGRKRLRQVASRLSQPRTRWKPVRYLWPLVPLRNLLVLTVALKHGFRRLLPPFA